MDRTSAAASLVLAAVFLLSALALAPHPVAAQVGTSSLAGRVCSLDQPVTYVKAPDAGDAAGCGGSLPGATLHLTKAGVGGTGVAGVDKTASSDGNGTYQFTALADGTYTLKVERTGFEAVEASVKVAGATARDVGLKPQIVVVSGKVVDLAGAAVAYAHVTACCGPSVGSNDASTDGAGAFVLKMDAGERTFSVDKDGRKLFAEPRFVDGTQSLTLQVPPGPRPDAALHGTVADQDGRPIAGIEVRSYGGGPCCYAYDAAASSGTTTSSSTTTTASSPNSGGSSGVAIAARPYYYDGGNVTTTDAAGRYRLGVFGGNGVSVNVYRDGYVGFNKYVQVAQGEDKLLDIQLLKFPAKTAHLEGKVVDPATGKGLRFVSINVQSPAYGLNECSADPSDNTRTMAPTPMPAPEQGSASPEGSGTVGATSSSMAYPYDGGGYNGCAITIHPDGSFSGNVTPGYTIIQVYYDAYRACPPPSDGNYRPCLPEYYGWTQTMTLAADATTPLTVRLEQRPAPDAVLSGYLLDDDTGKPLVGAQVSFSGEDGAGYGSATTDQDGSYRVRMRSGHLSVYASAEGHLQWQGTLTVADGETPLDIRLTAGEQAGGGCCYGCCYYADKAMAQGAPASAGRTYTSSATASPMVASAGGGGGANAAFEDLHGGLGPYDPAARQHALAQSGHASPGAGILLLLGLVGCAALVRRRLP
ncbi:MAG: Carboxypeptidase regulatory-like domain [Thermoplasmata archaeon]|jgi:hypothetical protein|nr:Carboxypeptidase regulatory-like domain [Thermoplasmata archaeon]